MRPGVRLFSATWGRERGGSSFASTPSMSRKASAAGPRPKIEAEADVNELSQLVSRLADWELNAPFCSLQPRQFLCCAGMTSFSISSVLAPSSGPFQHRAPECAFPTSGHGCPKAPPQCPPLRSLSVNFAPPVPGSRLRQLRAGNAPHLGPPTAPRPIR